MYNNITSPVNINSSYAPPTNRYEFHLSIIDFENNIKSIKKIESKPHSKLIKFNDKIKFTDIKQFKIMISHEMDSSSLDYSLEGTLDNNKTTYIQQNNNIFIEFTNNTNGYSLCSCSLTINNIFVSPPNY
jgi:hypothetical protein